MKMTIYMFLGVKHLKICFSVLYDVMVITTNWNQDFHSYGNATLILPKPPKTLYFPWVKSYHFQCTICTQSHIKNCQGQVDFFCCHATLVIKWMSHVSGLET